MARNDPYTPDNETRFTMRINTEILNRVKIEAQKSKRSAVKEIEFILEQWLDEHCPKE